jgi:hypothetical protein
MTIHRATVLILVLLAGAAALIIGEFVDEWNRRRDDEDPEPD